VSAYAALDSLGVPASEGRIYASVAPGVEIISVAELDTITVKGFKSLESLVDFQLAPINLLIGPNGAGKSNFVQVFEFLHAVRAGRLQEYVVRAGGASRLLHFGAAKTKSMAFKLSFQGGVNQYELALAPTSSDQLVPLQETVSFWDKAQHARPYDETLWPKGSEAAISDPGASRISGYVRKHLGSWRVYHFQDTSAQAPLKNTADVDDNRFLRSDGANLPAFLYFLRSKHESSYRLIQRTVQQAAPFFEDFQLEPQQLNPNKIRLEWRHKRSEAYFDASSLSDGTLRFVALATLFLQPEALRPSVIVVDEPELGLHPSAVEMLAALVRTASEKTQVIVSTQSALLLDHFDPQDVVVADRVEGSTRLSRLDPHRLVEWLKEYSLGQLWEKNEFGGRPAEE
jgi:predicted ATPase